MASFRRRLHHRFTQQAAFADGYSPLYHRIFATVAGWFDAADPDGQAVVDWLDQVGRVRQPFDVPILLVAGLHERVLAGALPALARCYPSVGGAADGADSAEFPPLLARAILDQRDRLAAFIANANVQTNETGRGLVWLLPLAALRPPAVHLVDLGASAGLNLVAEQRGYRLQPSDGRPPTALGLAADAQFSVTVTGDADALPTPFVPRLLTRLGADMLPLRLESAEGAPDPARERLLQAYVWADHTERLARLREGIAAYRAVQQTDVPVRLFPVRLPDELPPFLAQVAAACPGSDPVVLTNTYITIYLPEHGRGLRRALDAWAPAQERPVIWLQWEPPDDDTPPPALGWCAFSATVWHGGDAAAWRLGWVHPHGHALHIGPGWREFCAAWGRRGL